ncbi:PREDICTED: uncharacterized protein LOC108546075 [Eufriesea mexicana]|uniref:uncharacterized protein LOC108546075 n=1 Tax=Eufriesea mexicana TaxID=516756 RepID=UPI00083BF0E4|nr:PREDICTED: uncharacterized protein LOC108546075 [Eufriesea mexicana]XP_017753487.1 PREDICTED: uncharacterized protein LOC108546075 [Eufriesea mexicana]
MLPSSRLLQEEPSESVHGSATPATPSDGSTALSPMVVHEVEGNDDDPPPYSAVVPPNHVGWPFDFSGNRYSTCNPPSYRADATPLARFQTGPTPGSGFHHERTDGQHSIPMPLMPCRLFMFGSRRSLFSHEGLPFRDNISVSKDSHGRTRKYGAILVGAAVIVFLMVLSLLVRFIMNKHLWRG